MWRTRRFLLSAISSSKVSYGKTLCLPATKFPARPKAREVSREDYNARLYAHQQATRDDASTWVLHDGPPYANGTLHMGHFVNKVLKDMINKYWLMRGKQVLFYPGWDCHGLPIEQKALAESTDLSAVVPATVRTQAEAFAREAMLHQRAEFKSWGIMADWENAYLTMEPDYEAVQLDVFWELYNQGLIYRSHKPVHWSPSSQTALAESELEYAEEHTSAAIYVSFPVSKLGPSLDPLLTEAFHDMPDVQLHMLTWTTTPWTLVANKAMAYNEELQYSAVRFGGNDSKNVYIVATDCISLIEDATGMTAEVLDKFQPNSFPGWMLAGTVCTHPLFQQKESHLIKGKHVTSVSGTGLVHTAPGHGMEDFVACQDHMKATGLDTLTAFSPVNEQGRYTEQADEVAQGALGDVKLEGLLVLSEGNEVILNHLQSHPNLLHINTKYTHRYPYDWRTHKPILFRATPQWFTRLTDIQVDAVNTLESVRVIPDGAKRRLEAFLLSRREWCISRQRSWGVPIPVFYHKKDKSIVCTEESIRHVQSLFRKHGSNAWFTLPLSELLPPSLQNHAEDYYKSNETMDVWFDSGSSWRAALKQRGVATPVDMYLEGSDQHRGWFQSSLLTSVATTKEAPYKCIVSHGFVVDENRKKMSKSIGNVISPSDIIKAHSPVAPVAPPVEPGIKEEEVILEQTKKKKKKKKKKVKKMQQFELDVLRLWVASTDYSSDMSIGPVVLSASQEYLHKIRLISKFLLGCLDDFTPEKMVPYAELSLVDKYMLHCLYGAEEKTSQLWADYEMHKVISQLQPLLHQTISAFYLDVSKDSLYTDPPDSLSRRSRQTVLHHILAFFLRTLAPITVDTAEEIFAHIPDAMRDLLVVPQENDTSSMATVFDCGWHDTPAEWHDANVAALFEELQHIKSCVNRQLEVARGHGRVGSALDARVELFVENGPLNDMLQAEALDLRMVLQVSQVTLCDRNKLDQVKETASEADWHMEDEVSLSLSEDTASSCIVRISKAPWYLSPSSLFF